MTSFYDILDTLKTYLQGNTNVNSVTFGDIFEVDLAKQTIFPLSHIIVNSCTFQDHVVQFNLQILCMDMIPLIVRSYWPISAGNQEKLL